MDSYTFELIDPGLILLTYHASVTDTLFRQAAEEQVRFAREHVGGEYVIIVDYTNANLAPSAMDFRLNMWAARLDPTMLAALLVSRNLVVTTATNIVQRVTHKSNVEVFRNVEEATARARVILAERAQRRTS